MRVRNPNRGHASSTTTYWCAHPCHRFYDSAVSGKPARAEAIQNGWRYTKKQGWLCSVCVRTRGKGLEP